MHSLSEQAGNTCENIQKLKKRLGLFSLLLSVALAVVKFYAWYESRSYAVLSDALESLINIAASSFALYAIVVAGRPRDENHPYGHGKVEFFSMGFEGGLIFLSGLAIVGSSVRGLLVGAEVPSALGLAAGLVLLTAFANGAMGYYLLKTGRRLNSPAIEGDGQHLLSDALSSGTAIIALIVVMFTEWAWADPVAAIATGLYILRNGFLLLRSAISGLMDETDYLLVNRLVNELQVKRRPQWIDVHNLRVQKFGASLHIDCHVSLPCYLSLEQAHGEVSDFEMLAASIAGGETEMFVHADPCVFQQCPYCRLPDCPIRKAPFTSDLDWTPGRVMRNEKHALRGESSPGT